MERKEAIEVIKKNWPDSSFTMLREALETLVQELKENYDERIRKEILNYIIKGSESYYDVQQYGKEKFEKWIAWLEKKSENGVNCDDREIPNTWKPSDEMLKALYRIIPENVMEKSEDEMLLDKLYQGLKYGKVLSEK